MWYIGLRPVSRYTSAGKDSTNLPLLPTVTVNACPAELLAVTCPGSGLGEPGAGPPTATSRPMIVPFDFGRAACCLVAPPATVTVSAMTTTTTTTPNLRTVDIYSTKPGRRVAGLGHRQSRPWPLSWAHGSSRQSEIVAVGSPTRTPHAQELGTLRTCRRCTERETTPRSPLRGLFHQGPRDDDRSYPYARHSAGRSRAPRRFSVWVWGEKDRGSGSGRAGTRLPDLERCPNAMITSQPSATATSRRSARWQGETSTQVAGHACLGICGIHPGAR